MYEPQGVVFLGVEKGDRRTSFSGNIRAPKDFVEKLNWTFKNGVDFTREVYTDYNATMDTYYVIGRDGIIRYISPVVSFELGAINVEAIAAEIEDALDDPVPVESVTWSSIKKLLP